LYEKLNDGAKGAVIATQRPILCQTKTKHNLIERSSWWCHFYWRKQDSLYRESFL